MKKRDLGDIIEVVIIVAVLITGLLYTVNGLMNEGGISGASGRYYETYENR
jgi:hypothetical protein